MGEQAGYHIDADPIERATTDSMRQQARTYRDEINALRTENQALREELARRLGAARAAAVTRRS
jgi:regulator of replication initiation timing